MRWNLLFFVALFSSSVLDAQPGVNYQAAVRDAQGAIIANTNVSITITLADGENGPILYQETHTTTSNELGLINLIIGEGTVDQGTYASITGVQDLNIGIEAQVGDGPDIVDVGFTKVGAVPFALYGEDADADPGNEMQSLSLENDTLKIEGGVGVSLESIKSPWERIDSGYILDLEPTLARSGMHRGLRLQYFSRSGPTLVIEEDDCYYELGPKHSNRQFNGLSFGSKFFGNIGENLTSEEQVEVGTNLNITPTLVGSSLGLVGRNQFGYSAKGVTPDVSNPTQFSYLQHDDYELKARIEALECLVVLAYEGTPMWDMIQQDGVLGESRYLDDSFVLGNIMSRYSAEPGSDRSAQSTVGASHFTASENGLTTQLGSFPGTDQSNGWLTLYRENSPVVLATANNEEGGLVATNGPNGNRNISLNTLGGEPNKGAVLIYGDAGDTPLGWFYVDANGQSILRVDQVVMNASPQNSNGEIVSYGALLGPEQAVYDRGTAKLINGEATITCSEHFQSVADPNSMTVTITPLSAESEGVAVVEKTLHGFKVKELHQGVGNYSFDYVVTCTRKDVQDVGTPEMREASVEDIQGLLPKGPIKNVRDLVREN
ncbi:MAG: hypothetical protein OEM26_00215 [Saprospiraceae bacterium]|nr:hypothetical protein [Saprospiraceae bacterium]